MTTPRFIEWLDSKMDDYGSGKLIPPDDVLVAELDARIESKVREAVTERILREAGLRLRSPRPSLRSKSLLPRFSRSKCSSRSPIGSGSYRNRSN
jgi:hypothetical protein